MTQTTTPSPAPMTQAEEDAADQLDAMTAELGVLVRILPEGSSERGLAEIVRARVEALESVTLREAE